MKKLTIDVLAFLKQNAKARQEVAELFKNSAGARLADVTMQLWIRRNDPRLTCISVLEIISFWLSQPIDELTTTEV